MSDAASSCDFVTPGKMPLTTLRGPSVCDNCRRIVTPPPKRVAVFVDGRTTAERLLCSACLVHVKEQFQLPAPWVGVAPVKVR